jgi:YhcH/YjgK/YiaL family protein
MIYDVFANRKLYFSKKDAFNKALDFAGRFDISQPDGRYEIDGDKLYAMVMTYQTKSADEARFEAHQKYIDIQLLLEGREFIDLSTGEKLGVDTAYSDEKDVVFFTSPAYFTSVLLEPGRFAVLYPDDIHRPCRRLDEPMQVRKIVIKVRIGN